MAHHVVRPRTYLLVFAALIALTALTVGASQIDLGGWHLTVGLIFAVAKATLVVLFFMHLWYSSRLTWVVALSGAVFLGILIFLTMNDYLTRGWPSGL
jgi:cytochrome c oxidase subunit 4